MSNKLRTIQALGRACLLIGMLFGCTTQVPEPPPSESEPPPPPSIPAHELRDLLEAADRARYEDRLTYPEDGSALAIYESILARVPDQEDALRGIEGIVETFIDRSMAALERRRFATARSMLARARLISPDHPSIEPTAAQLRLLEEADIELVNMHQDILRDDPDAAKATLTNLARTEPGQRCRFNIFAKNDAQGRWIYQALAQGSPDRRLQAEVEIRLPAGVERVCYNT